MDKEKQSYRTAFHTFCNFIKLINLLLLFFCYICISYKKWHKKNSSKLLYSSVFSFNTSLLHTLLKLLFVLGYKMGYIL